MVFRIRVMMVKTARVANVPPRKLDNKSAAVDLNLEVSKSHDNTRNQDNNENARPSNERANHLILALRRELNVEIGKYREVRREPKDIPSTKLRISSGDMDIP